MTLLASCGAPDVRGVTITTHYVPDCAPPEEDAPEQLELIALGDFDRSNDSVAIVESDAAEQVLRLPWNTRAAELSALSDRSFWGSGELDARSRIPILLWQKNRACRLGPELGGAADADEGWMLAASLGLGTVIALGPGEGGRAPASGVLVDLGDASATPIPATTGAPLQPGSTGVDSAGTEPGDALEAPREHATLSELGAGFLLAGGLDPSAGRPSSAAWRIQSVRGDLEASGFSLATPRARHAALSLSRGRTLLIGGESEDGAALASVEVISDDGRETPLLDLLATPRIDPQALLLDGSRVLVGGGFTWAGPEGAAGARRPIASVEFVSTDLAQVADPPVELEPAALDRAFAPIAAGAALAVGGCGAPEAGAKCIACEAGGCVSRRVWWIDPQGEAHALEPLPEELAVARPALVAGAEGAPWLVAGTAIGRFDPWAGRFTIVDVTLPVSGGGLIGRPQALGTGAFVWLHREADTVGLLGLYHSQRGRFTQDIAPLLIGGTQGIVPHRPPTAAEGNATALFHSTSGGLRLMGSAAAVSIADTDYENFTLELALESGPPPLLRLTGADTALSAGSTFGGLDCPWPDLEVRAEADTSSATRLVVRRSGSRVQLGVAAAAAAQAGVEPFRDACQRALPERVSIQIVGTRAGTTALSRIEIRRSVD